MALAAHDPRFPGYQDILLLSDGDGPGVEAESEGGVKDAADRQIPVHVVGLGDPTRPTELVLGDGDSAEFVGTKLQEDFLKDIARRTRGEYLPARRDVPALGDWFTRAIEPRPSRELSDDAIPQPKDRAVWFAGAGAAVAPVGLGAGAVMNRRASQLVPLAGARRGPRRRGEPAAGRRPAARGQRRLRPRRLGGGRGALPAGRGAEPTIRAWSRSTRGRPSTATATSAGPRSASAGPWATRRSRPSAAGGPCTTSATAWSARPARRDVKTLQAAIECFELAARDATDDGVRTDAGHNLEVAKLLWAKARAKRPPGERDPEWDDRPDSKRPPRRAEAARPRAGRHRRRSRRRPRPGPSSNSARARRPGRSRRRRTKPRAGAGNLPVIAGHGQVTQLSARGRPADSKRAAERLQHERQNLRKEAAQGDRPRAKDW